MWMKDYFWYCTTCQKGVRAHTHPPTHTTCTFVVSSEVLFYRVCIQFDSWEILQLTQSRAFSHDCADPTWLCFTFDFVQEECSLSLSLRATNSPLHMLFLTATHPDVCPLVYTGMSLHGQQLWRPEHHGASLCRQVLVKTNITDYATVMSVSCHASRPHRHTIPF